MGVIDRLAKALGGYGNNIKAAAVMLSPWNTQPTYAGQGFTTNAKSRFGKNELIFACVDRTGNAATQIRLQVRSKSDGKVLDTHALAQVIRRPNPFMSQTDLWEAVIKLQLLAGRCVLEKERDNAGRVIGLWPLRPDWLTIIPSKTRYIAGFEYGPSGGNKVFIPYQDTVDLPVWDPTSPLIAMTPQAPATTAARITDTDTQATDYVKLVFEKGGVPPGLLKTRQKLLESQVQVLRRRWRERYGGYTNWLEPAVLDSDAEYQKIGMTFTEMGFEYLDRRNESRICAVFDIPPIVAGAFVGLEKSNYDNYLTARKAWWQDSLLPRFGYLLDRLTLELLPEFGGDIYLEWDLQGVHALREERDLEWRLAADAFRTGAVTVNEYRGLIGMPAIGAPGEVFLRSLANYEAPVKAGEILNPNAENQQQEAAKVLTLPEGKAVRPPDEKERHKFEKQLSAALKEALQIQLTDLVEEIERDGIQAVLAA